MRVDVIQPLVGQLQGGFDLGGLCPDLFQLRHYHLLKEFSQYAHQHGVLSAESL
jgi:hypothetical protein